MPPVGFRDLGRILEYVPEARASDLAARSVSAMQNAMGLEENTARLEPTYIQLVGQMSRVLAFLTAARSRTQSRLCCGIALS